MIAPATIRARDVSHTDLRAGARPKAVRCALYVRKSTEEGLDQAFNSLDAQRLACEEYVRARAAEGWTSLADQYTDGGFSGATVKRPAFQRLLADIEARKIDCVVVHRVDRLSRSLLDFARLMAFFQEHGVSFVSVTQNFSTADPVGRLTLNLLATFSEFEREMIVARTRDKVAAARRRGRWTGGMPVLGYDVDPRGGRIHVNEPEAAQVREIFDLYPSLGSLTRVVEELNRQGWRRKSWTTKDGSTRAGGGFDKPSLLRLLRNPLYVGKVHHRGVLHDGEHPAIVSEETWCQVQERLTRNGTGCPGDEPQVRGSTSAARSPTASASFLMGLLYCAQCGCRMTPTYTSKGDRRFRYYVCQTRLKKGAHACPTGRVAAHEIEKQVVEQIRAIGRDPDLVAETVHQATVQRGELIAALEAEVKALRRELRVRRAALKRSVTSREHGKSGVSPIEERIAAIEARLAALPRELHAAKRGRIDETGVRSALEAFGPVWDSLWPTERARVLGLLVERIEHDGREGHIAIRFRVGGFGTLGAAP